jgi:hypothetical protein
MNDVLRSLRDLLQEDVGGRGLRTDPSANLITACPDDFAAACRSIAETAQAKVLIVTGFHIVYGDPPSSETDGPLGALFLARALAPLGIEVLIATDGTAIPALNAGLEFCHLQDNIQVIALPPEAWDEQVYKELVFGATDRSTRPLTHLIALERVGPSHTLKSLQSQPALAKLPPKYHHFEPGAAEGIDTHLLSHAAEVVGRSRELPGPQLLALCLVVEDFERQVPPEERNRCHSMRGIDITENTSPAHLLFEEAAHLDPPSVTIGIGDGGNEIGMGKVAWDVIRRNITNGDKIACRVATDYLITSGISNWGAYGLAAGVRLLRGAAHDPDLFDVERERQLLQVMVDFGPLVDGVSGQRCLAVDGLAFDRYAEVLKRMGALLAAQTAEVRP